MNREIECRNENIDEYDFIPVIHLNTNNDRFIE